MHRALTMSLVAAFAGAVIGMTPITADAAATATYSVDCAAKHNGNGLTSPWNSLNAVNSHSFFAGGEKILFKRGTVCKGRLHPSGNGVPSHPIVLGAYGKGAKPTLRGGGTPDQTGVVQLTDQSYWTVQDLHITNTAGGRASSLYRAGILLVNSGSATLRGITVQRLSVDAVASNMSAKRASPREWGGIVAVTNGNRSAGFAGLRILNNSVQRVGRSGIVVSNHTYPKGSDTGLRIAGNHVTSSRGDGIVVLGSTRARIDHNRVAGANDEWPCKECGSISPQTANAAIWTAHSKRVQIDHNEAYGTKRLGGDGEGLDVDASAVDTVVEYNYSHDNQGGGVLLCGASGAVIRFNIFENNDQSALSFYGKMPSKNTQFYNNTVYASAASDAKVVRTFGGIHGSKVSFKNNVIYNYGRADYQWPTSKVAHAANTMVGHLVAGRPYDSTSSTTNPDLKAPGSGKIGAGSLKGYKPKHPSTFRRGVAIPGNVTQDFFGKTISPKHPPRGAAG